MADKVFIDETEKCPQCGSFDFEGGSLVFVETKVFQHCTCNECGYVWDDVYNYAYSISEALPEKKEDLIDRIIEVSKWSPIITQKVTRENCVLLESGARQGVTHWVAFQVNGGGFTIDFEEHTASRDTAYDEETH